MLAIFFIVIAALSLIAAYVAENKEILPLILFGAQPFPEQAGTYETPKTLPLIVLVLLATTIASPIALQVVTNKIAHDYRIQEANAVQAKRDLEDFIEWGRPRLAEVWNNLRNAHTQNQLNDLRSVYGNAEVARLKNNDLVLASEGTLDIGGLTTQVEEIRVLGAQEQELKFVLIVHVFQDVAYWEYDEGALFVRDDDQTPVDLSRILHDNNAQESFDAFDIVVGLGLESQNSSTSSGVSRSRAHTLCGIIRSQLNSRSGTKPAGLDIGMYRGSVMEDDLNREPRLRPVIIVGVDVIDDSTDFNQFAQELLRNVRLSGLDLGLFENLSRTYKDDKELPWVTFSDCAPQVQFVR